RAVGRLEQAREVMRAEANLLRQAAQRQAGAEVLPDQLRQPPLLCRPQRSAARPGIEGALRAAAARQDAEQRDAHTLYVQSAVPHSAQRLFCELQRESTDALVEDLVPRLQLQRWQLAVRHRLHVAIAELEPDAASRPAFPALMIELAPLLVDLDHAGCRMK